jgi:hypothetical protein
MPVHRRLRELKAFFRSDVEASEFWSLLAGRYIVTGHSGKVFVHCARHILTVQLSDCESSLYHQERSENAKNGLNAVHF